MLKVYTAWQFKLKQCSHFYSYAKQIFNCNQDTLYSETTGIGIYCLLTIYCKMVNRSKCLNYHLCTINLIEIDQIL